MKTTIDPHTIAFVPVKLASLPKGQDFSFNPEYNGNTEKLRQNGAIYAYIVDSNMSRVQVRNDSDVPVVIPRHSRIGTVHDYDEEGCYMIDSDSHGLAAAWKPNGVRVSESEASIKLTNGITIYGEESSKTAALRKVCEAFPNIWRDSGPVCVPESERMRIPLKDGWQDMKLGTRVYPLSQKDKDLLNTTFDELHSQDRMGWSEEFTPINSPVFVVWRNVFEKGSIVRKGRAVIDIRRLNQITIRDNYPLPLLDDMIAAVRGAKYITLVDATKFFYQWLVATNDQHKLTVASHRGQEYYKVAPMGFCNSPPYVQRQMDRMLREFREFCRTYIDDVVIFSATLEEHVRHLSCVFQKFTDMNVSINPKKSYIGYPSVTLLGQKVDGLGLATDEDKIKALLDIQFPINLKDLEIYLGLTNWLRKHIPYYSQACSALQARKTALLKDSPREGNARRAYVSKTYIDNPTEGEFASYNTIRSNFVKPSFLYHLNPDRPVYADVDSSVAYGHGAIIYQVEGDPDISTIMKDGKAGLFPRSKIQPILFLSKLLSSAESRYWPTELEVAGLVWLMKKARHLLEAGTREKTTTIFTDHSAATFIARQTSLTSSSVEKLNLRLIRASQYLSQFNLRVIYRPGKIHLVPDALSRLLGSMEESHKHLGRLDHRGRRYRSIHSGPGRAVS